MTDARTGRSAARTLVQPAAPSDEIARIAARTLVQPATPNAEIARTAARALVQPGVPDAQIGRTGVRVLIGSATLSVDARAAREALRVLLRPSVGTTISWWDGTALQSATLAGKWNGATFDSVDSSMGEWDGVAIQPLS